MSRTGADLIEVGRDALRRHAWQEAFEHLRPVGGDAALTARDLAGLGDAAWWVGRLDESIAAHERAFGAYMDEDDHRAAGLIAVTLAKSYFSKGEGSLGQGWLSRASRLLENDPDSEEAGHLARVQGVVELETKHNYEAAAELASKAYEIGARLKDKTLMALGLQDRGRALAEMGEVAAGLALMEEATIPAVSGELPPMATATIFCNMISATERLAEFGRAGEWGEAAKRWCDRQTIAGFPGMCRVYRAEIMRMRGDWIQAEHEARTAAEELRGFNRGYCAEALYELGEIRLRVGDLEGTQQAFDQAHDLGRDPQPGLALLLVAQKKPDVALSCIRRALEDDTPPLRRARLLPAHVEIALLTGDPEGAQKSVAELDEIAATFGTAALKAAALAAKGALMVARGDISRQALKDLREVVRLWHEVGAPYEIARARMVLAEAFRTVGDEQAAVMELLAALAGFQQLGAMPDVRAVRELLGPESSLESRGSRAMRTFMFTDIAKSTDLVEVIGDDAWQDLVMWHDNLLRSLFVANNGVEIDHAGDGFFVAFDDSDAALRCAVAIQQKLAEHRHSHGFAPSVRVGIHATEATSAGGGYKGKGVHEAARIAGLAKGGEIIASSQTVTGPATRTPPRLSQRRVVTLKGISDPVEVVSIDWR
ncbi:MAG: hypothetical protein M3277_09630 [Actinomycetota bacterium]|nr:hypothetical protein [Actinomycetota bacterium]